MALHGQIGVNSREIGHWSARRLRPTLDQNGDAPYECRVKMSDRERVLVFEVVHHFEDGALALAAEVLKRAHDMREEQGHD